MFSCPLFFLTAIIPIVISGSPSSYQTDSCCPIHKLSQFMLPRDTSTQFFSAGSISSWGHNLIFGFCVSFGLLGVSGLLRCIVCAVLPRFQYHIFFLTHSQS